MKYVSQHVSVFLLCLGAIVLFGLNLSLAGFLILGIGALSLFLNEAKFRHDLILLYIAIAILGLTPISTSVTYEHIFTMGIGMFCALFIPYSLSRVVYKENIVRFFFNHKKIWTLNEIIYLLGVIVIAYFLVPMILIQTGSFHDWPVALNFDSLFRLFIGINLVGVWDELFFIFTVFAFLKRFLPFITTNIAQATLFSAFLYKLGFHGWGIIVVFIFTFLQGVVYTKTHSIAYLITIHLAVDTVLYLVLIHANFPQVFPFFLTG